jgi:hypothetical protein
VNSIEAFLIGVLSTAFVTAAVFFLRFWRDTRDRFFLAFAASFLIEGLSRVVVLFVDRPSQPPTAVFVVRLFASGLIIWAILRKNYGSDR